LAWLLAAGVAVLFLVLWQVVACWPRGWGLPGSPRPLLLVLVRDQADVVEGLLRVLLGRLARWAEGPAWEVAVLDAGSGDETPEIAKRLLAGAGVSFVPAGPGWGGIVEEFVRAGRPVLVLPLVGVGVPCGIPLVPDFVGGNSRMPFPDGELPD